MFNTH